jgi:hypothetical protein
MDTGGSPELILEEAKARGWIYASEFADFFPDLYAGGPELDEVLAELEKAGIKILPEVSTHNASSETAKRFGRRRSSPSGVPPGNG